MESKKVLIVCSEFPPQPGGMGNHAYNLASQLIEQGYQVLVLTDYRSKTGKEETVFDASKRFQIRRVRRFKIILFTYVKRLLEARTLLKSEVPDILIASGKFQLWLAAFGVRSRGIKRIGVIHGSEINLTNSWQQTLNNHSLKRLDYVIAVSNFTKKLVDHLNLKEITVISNGFNKRDLDEMDCGNSIEGSPKLITVGNLSRRKGQHNVILKLPSLKNTYPNIHYHMVGTPSDQKRLLALAKSLQVESHVTFHGIVNEKERNRLLNECDIFVMLSEHTPEGDVEGFGIAILEANYLGLPAIGALNCGIEDAIQDNKSGILIDPTNEVAFLKAVDEICGNKAGYSRGAKEWASKHSWKIIIKRYMEVIESL